MKKKKPNKKKILEKLIKHEDLVYRGHLIYYTLNLENVTYLIVTRKNGNDEPI